MRLRTVHPFASLKCIAPFVPNARGGRQPSDPPDPPTMTQTDDLPTDLLEETYNHADVERPSGAQLGDKLASDVRYAAAAAHQAVEYDDYNDFKPALWEETFETVVYAHDYFARSQYGPALYGAIIEMAENADAVPEDPETLINDAGGLKAAAERAYERLVTKLAFDYKANFSSDDI